MGAFVIMGSIDSRTDETVTDIISGAQGSLHIGAIMRININGIIQLLLLCKVGKSRDQILVIRTTGIFGTDRNHPFGAAKVAADTAHIDRNHLLCIIRYDTSAVPYFFIYCK